MRSFLWAVAGMSVFACGAVQDEKPKTEIPKVLLDPALPAWKEKAPAEFKVKFTTSKGDFTVKVERAWAPLGADRFHGLVKNGYFDDVRFFRVVSGFMAQCGIHGAPEVNKAWREATIADDPVVKSNLRGWLSYAIRGPHTRTTQFFINLKDNKSLDTQKFAPFGQVIEGMEIVDKLYSKYGDGPPRGRGPDQVKLRELGNAYLTANFKELDFIKTARIVPEADPPKQ